MLTSAGQSKLTRKLTLNLDTNKNKKILKQKPVKLIRDEDCTITQHTHFANEKYTSDVKQANQQP